MNTELLAAFIESHGNKVQIIDRHTLRAQVVYSQRCPDGAVTTFTQWEYVPATMKAVKQWLGY